MQLNPTFVSNIRDIYGKAGESWLKDLPTQLQQLAAKWNLRLLEAMPDLSYNFVGLAEIRSTGEIAIIKIAPVGEYIAVEARWLRCFNKGVPKLYQHDEEQHALLMERLEPGNSLKTLVRTGHDDSATRIICQTIRDLQSQQQKQFVFKHLSELSGSLSLLKGHFDGKILSKAESWFRELTTDRTQDVVLHGDLHHDNILASGTTWKAIDPHGYIGDPTFEVGMMIYNPLDCFPNDHSIAQTVKRRLKILAEELPFDSQRIKAWAFCMTVLSAAWTFEGHAKVPEFAVKIASAIDQA
jgi:streptomycin 6-kinase